MAYSGIMFAFERVTELPVMVNSDLLLMLKYHDVVCWQGLIQSVFELQDGSGVVVTIGKYITPNHLDINGNGIEPDFKKFPGRCFHSVGWGVNFSFSFGSKSCNCFVYNNSCLGWNEVAQRLTQCHKLQGR